MTIQSDLKCRFEELLESSECGESEREQFLEFLGDFIAFGCHELTKVLLSKISSLDSFVTLQVVFCDDPIYFTEIALLLDENKHNPFIFPSLISELQKISESNFLDCIREVVEQRDLRRAQVRVVYFDSNTLSYREMHVCKVGSIGYVVLEWLKRYKALGDSLCG